MEMSISQFLDNLTVEDLKRELTVVQAEADAATRRLRRLQMLLKSLSTSEFSQEFHRKRRAQEVSEGDSEAALPEDLHEPCDSTIEPSEGVADQVETPADEDLSLADILARQLTLSPSGIQRLAILTGEDEADIKLCLTENPKRFEKAMGLWRLVQA